MKLTKEFKRENLLRHGFFSIGFVFYIRRFFTDP